VVVVDDSAVVRQVLKQLLESDPAIQVLAAVADPVLALDRMRREWPDVIVTDVQMPRMDGVSFVRKVMAERPTPIVVCSAFTERGAETTMQVLAAGALQVVSKPTLGVKAFLEDTANGLIAAVKGAARAKVRRSVTELLPKNPAKHSADAVLPARDAAAFTQITERVVAIGTSTGGTQALEYVLGALPRLTPGIVIVQHMPEMFTAAFAQRLNGVCEIEVREARSGDRVLAGRALIAPGGRHMLLERSGAQYHVEVVDGPPVNRHRPSVDVLFRSVARAAGANACGIILTGMGDDGARGLGELRQTGARTVAQDEESCVVFGMPKEAIKLGAAEDVLSLAAMPGVISSFGAG
jgi:two-component system chemotaxis response regulator CheB